MSRKLTIASALLAWLTPGLAAGERPASVPALAVAAPAQAQTYKIPGEAGRKWVDTGVDLKPGDLVYLFAQGEVNYGAGVGTVGPAGSSAAAAAQGFPADTPYRYGLVARITSSRTNPEDDLREDHAYGQGPRLCARAGGRLWLTANDNEPSDNSGEYFVTIKIGRCDPHPAPAPTPDPGSGTFRVKIIGFRVEHVVHDGPFDAGDDAYVAWDAAEFDATGEFVGQDLAGQSLVYGDTGRRRVQVRAGTQGRNGGLRSGDEVKEIYGQASAQRFPMLVGDFRLADGQNAVLFAPTIWIARDDPGGIFGQYRQRFRGRVRLASYDVRQRLRENSTQFHWVYAGTNDAGGWFDQWLLRMFDEANRGDRPLGISEALAPQASFANKFGVFTPHVYLLTYKSVTDFLRTSGATLSRTPVPFEARYSDSGPRGLYHILMTIERLQ